MYEQVIKIFFEVDDFCKHFEQRIQEHLLSHSNQRRKRKPELCLSEIMTILILFHTGRFRNFKSYYQNYVQLHLKQDFPHLVSYNRFVELKGRALLPLVVFQLQRKKGTVTGISFIDSTSLSVCRNQRIHKHRVFRGIAQRGKTSMGWFYGFKLHLLVNECGEIISWVLTPGNISDNNISTCLQLGKNVWGKVFGDKGYISGKLFSALFQEGIHLITRIKKNMKNTMTLLEDKILLRKRSIIETINDQLKNISQIEHTRHRSPTNFLVNLVAGLIAYSFQPKKPSLIKK